MLKFIYFLHSLPLKMQPVDDFSLIDLRWFPIELSFTPLIHTQTTPVNITHTVSRAFTCTCNPGILVILRVITSVKVVVNWLF